MRQVSRRQFAQMLAGSAAVFAIGGIRPILQKPGAYLIPFESLKARQRAWDAFNADPDWHALREAGPVNVKEISLYRALGSEPRP